MQPFFLQELTALGLILTGTLCGAVAGMVVTCLVVWIGFTPGYTNRDMQDISILIRILLCVGLAIPGGIIGGCLGALIGLVLLAVRGQILFGVPLFLLIMVVGYGVMRRLRLV